ncbi:hypothetical protein [Phenylobacterium sp.]|jgi:hypothetical protein|uniref:hypothetical protein n=1 Tax=Phenylobacterium sp. TaxID=1871053 RepID=UPI002E2F5E53|nr:hypothetical protein [Phenylobacterium sp.]HEX3363707.1 hypothetical protein [Phenylobacterium sp.]
MTRTQLPFFALAALAALALAGASQAAEPEAVATAPASGPSAPVTTADQIDNYLKTSPALALPKDALGGVVSGDAPRQVHGVVDVSVGSNGYRSAFVASEIPVGKTGTATIAVGETRFNGRGFAGGPGYRGGSQNLALGLALGGADPTDWRCRQAMETAAEARLDNGTPSACRARPTPPPAQ